MAEGCDQYILREFDLDDYPDYASWWYPSEPPDLDALPAIGLVSGDMKAVGFLANTDTSFAIITWWHANPLNKARESYNALKEIMKGLVDAALCIGKNMVFVYSKNRGMIRLLESLDFKNYNGHLVKRLDQ